MEKIWLKQYPAGVPAQIQIDLYASLVTLMEESFTKYRNLPAYLFMGKPVTFGRVDEKDMEDVAKAGRTVAEYFRKGPGRPFFVDITLAE